MSGLLKGIGKIFRKIGKVVRKVAAPLLAVGAIVLSGGAALGLGPLAGIGGWGGAVASGVSAMGIQGPLAGILTTVGTQMGQGAALGGLAGLVTGQGFGKGATVGAIGGAVTGGLTSAGLMPGMAPRAGAVTMSSRSGLIPGAGATTPAVQPAVADPSVVTGVATGGAGSVGPAGVITPAATAAPTVGSRIGGLLSSPVFGQVLAGAGQGLLSGMQAKDQNDLELEILRRRTASYEGAEPDAEQFIDTEVRPTPRSKWGQRHRRRYNPDTGRIEEIA